MALCGPWSWWSEGDSQPVRCPELLCWASRIVHMAPDPVADIRKLERPPHHGGGRTSARLSRVCTARCFASRITRLIIRLSGPVVKLFLTFLARTGGRRLHTRTPWDAGNTGGSFRLCLWQGLDPVDSFECPGEPGSRNGVRPEGRMDRPRTRSQSLNQRDCRSKGTSPQEGDGKCSALYPPNTSRACPGGGTAPAGPPTLGPGGGFSDSSGSSAGGSKGRLKANRVP